MTWNVSHQKIWGETDTSMFNVNADFRQKRGLYGYGRRQKLWAPSVGRRGLSDFRWRYMVGPKMSAKEDYGTVTDRRWAGWFVLLSTLYCRFKSEVCENDVTVSIYYAENSHAGHDRWGKTRVSSQRTTNFDSVAARIPAEWVVRTSSGVSWGQDDNDALTYETPGWDYAHVTGLWGGGARHDYFVEKHVVTHPKRNDRWRGGGVHYTLAAASSSIPRLDMQR